MSKKWGVFAAVFCLLLAFTLPVHAANTDSMIDSSMAGTESEGESSTSAQSGEGQTESESDSSAVSEAAGGLAQDGVGSKNITNYTQAAFRWLWVPILGIAVSLFLLIFINVRAFRQNRKRKAIVSGKVKRRIIVRKRHPVS